MVNPALIQRSALAPGLTDKAMWGQRSSLLWGYGGNSAQATLAPLSTRRPTRTPTPGHFGGRGRKCGESGERPHTHSYPNPNANLDGNPHPHRYPTPTHTSTPTDTPTPTHTPTETATPSLPPCQQIFRRRPQRPTNTPIPLPTATHCRPIPRSHSMIIYWASFLIVQLPTRLW